jgi:hypothetical protein
MAGFAGMLRSALAPGVTDGILPQPEETIGPSMTPSLPTGVGDEGVVVIPGGADACGAEEAHPPSTSALAIMSK